MKIFSETINDFINKEMIQLVEEDWDYFNSDEKYNDGKEVGDCAFDIFPNISILTEVGNKIIEIYRRLANLEYQEGKEYALYPYNLCGKGFYFNSKEELEDFLEIEDVSPYFIFKIIKKENGLKYLELCPNSEFRISPKTPMTILCHKDPSHKKVFAPTNSDNQNTWQCAVCGEEIEFIEEKHLDNWSRFFIGQKIPND